MTGLRWATQFCPSAKYILKCDLDTFINLPLLTRFLPIIKGKVRQFMIGHGHEKQLPPVLREGKWAVSDHLYPFDYFPPYLIGHSYAMTSDIVKHLLSVSDFIPLIPAEDAFITGVLARIIRVPRLHFDGFAHDNHVCLPCNIVYNEDITMTKMSLSRLLLLWRQISMDDCLAEELPLIRNQFSNDSVAIGDIFWYSRK